MSQSEEISEVEDLRPSLRGINLKVKCGEKREEREVTSRKTGETLRVTEALVGDNTGCVLLTLWNDDIDKAQEDHLYKLENVYTTVFKGSLRLNIGKYGKIEEIEDDEELEINLENNISDKEYEQQRPRYGGGGRPYGGGGGRSYGDRPYRGGGGNRNFSERRPRRRY